MILAGGGGRFSMLTLSCRKKDVFLARRSEEGGRNVKNRRSPVWVRWPRMKGEGSVLPRHDVRGMVGIMSRKGRNIVRIVRKRWVERGGRGRGGRMWRWDWPRDGDEDFLGGFWEGRQVGTVMA